MAVFSDLVQSLIWGFIRGLTSYERNWTFETSLPAASYLTFLRCWIFNQGTNRVKLSMKWKLTRSCSFSILYFQTFIYDFLLCIAWYSPLLSMSAASAYKGSPIQGLLLHIKSLLHTRASSAHKGSPAYEGFCTGTGVWIPGTHINAMWACACPPVIKPLEKWRQVIPRTS